MAEGSRRLWLEKRRSNRLLYETHTFDHLCDGLPTKDKEVKFDQDFPVKLRSDFINEPRLQRHVPPPEDIAQDIDLPLGFSKKQLGRHCEGFHEAINLVVKKVLKEVYFENDALRMFLRISKQPPSTNKQNTVEVDSLPFKKLLLILEAMKIQSSEKLGTDAFSKRMNKFLVKKVMDVRHNKEKYKIISKISTVIKMKKHIFQLFDEYEEKKLCLEKAWSIHENITSGRISWAAQYLTNTMNGFHLLEDNPPAHSPNKYYWHLAKMITHLRNQELLTSKIEFKNDQKKVRDWKLVIDRLVGFRENVKGSSMAYYRKLQGFLRATNDKRKVLALEFDGLTNYIDFFRSRADNLKKKEKDLRQHYEEVAKVIQHISKNKFSSCNTK